MTLLELQRKMAAAVMQPLAANYSMRETTDDGRSMHVEAAGFIKPNDRLTSFERLEIYNRQYWFRLMSSLSEDFPGLSAVIGEEKFEALTIAYVVDHPSTSFTLRDLGSHLEQWLRAHPAFLGRRHRLALDVVRIEWAHIESLDGAEKTPLTMNEMATLNETSRFSLQPHLRLLDLNYPADNLLVKIHSGQSDSGVASNAVAQPEAATGKTLLPTVRPKQIHLAVHRFDESVYYKRIDHEAYLLLRSIEDDRTLGDAIEAAFANSRIPETKRPTYIQAWFTNWAELGWLCGNTDMSPEQ
jgi:hypothetical protein